MAWLIIPRSVSIVPNRSSSSVPTQRLGIDRTTSWSHVRSVVGKAEPVRGLIRLPGAVMGQHPRTWFSSTTAGFPRADAAWLLRQISSLETPGVFDPAADCDAAADVFCRSIARKSQQVSLLRGNYSKS